MGLKIIISSAVELDEKIYVKNKLREMEKLHLIRIDELYDCADHATSWGIKSKQESINQKILSADWFICLIPEQTVGKATWEELKLILEAHKNGTPVAISVFHPMDSPMKENVTTIPEKRVSFDDIKKQAEIILGNEDEQYWISYQYDNREDLQKRLHEEYIKLYFTDKIFRTQHLYSLAKLGRDVNARDLYFDTERANLANGFMENKYFPRRSVDGKLQEAIMEQRKFIVLQGIPGSGKTRALYQLLADPRQLILADCNQYALGILANKNIIVVRQDNIHQVYQFLGREMDYDEENVLSEYCLVCDQIKDVFSMLNNEELYRFFDMVVHFKHVHMITTSIPSAFYNFCERWKEYGRKPLEDDQLTKVITIPQISSDEEESALRNWMLNELQGKTAAETIGDYIPKLNSYKQAIVRRLYEKSKELPYLSEFLSALQITETYRHDTALFIPVLITRKNLYPKDVPTNWKEFHSNVVKTINFLIANNIIWIRLSSSPKNETPEVIKALQEKTFSLEYEIDDEEDFLFDDELYPDTPISTNYTYGVNEIVWNELIQEDANRHMNQAETLLKDFQNVKDVVRSAKEFYRAFPSIRSMRRILPRIPHTDCYDEAAENLWSFVYNKCKSMEPLTEDCEEFLTVIGMLIGRSKDLSHIKDATNLILMKNLQPNYNIIGELYSVSMRLGKDIKPEINQYVLDFRKNYELSDNSFFSIAREIVFYEMTFDKAIEAVKHSNYKIRRKDGDKLLPLEDAAAAIELKIEQNGLEQLLAMLAKKGETIEEWITIFKLHQQMHVNLRRSTIRQFFAIVANQSIRSQLKNSEEKPQFLMKTHLETLLYQFADIIDAEDKESCFFYSISSSWNFSQAYSIYQIYFEIYNEDNPRMISTMLRTIRNQEFQRALNFLIEVDSRLKEKGMELNDICFNNLIKSAPNMGEALGVIPYLFHLQDMTLANILNVLKKKRRIKDKGTKTGTKNDNKIFYYAYSAVMRDYFFELRKSPHVIGLLHDLATTPKHERFIRETFLSHLDERKKRDLIDYSTVISSIRMKKNYRTLDQVWEIFNTCRNHYREENKYINSELYSSMMNKLQFLCKNNNEALIQQQGRLRAIIKEDYSRIIRDEYFFSAAYRFFPDKKIIDSEGNICSEFLKDITKSEISHIKPLNNIMKDLLHMDFNIIWKFYSFIIQFYQQSGRDRFLRPDIRTVTYLMEAANTKEQFEKADEAAKAWCVDTLLKNNKMYHDIYETKEIKLGITIKDSERKVEETTHEQPNKDKVKKQDYKERVDEIIELAIKDIYLYGCLTSTLFNLYLKKITDIKDEINRDISLSSDISKRIKEGTYRNLLNNLIKKYPNSLSYDALSYVYLINLTPSKWDAKQWIKVLQDKKKEYKYDMVICSTIALNADVCNADIDTALDYFELWEDIVYDIGYDPADPTSYSEATVITKYDNRDDYDGYWLTRSTHCIREMDHYWRCLKQPDGFVDKTALKFIKQQMDFFNQYSIPFPKYYNKGHFVDFKQEICKLS